MKQSYLNVGLSVIGIIVLVFVVSGIFGTSPMTILSLAWNLLVYLFFMIGFQIILPPLTGYLIRKCPIAWLDDQFGSSHDEIPEWLHWMLAIVLGLLAGYVWMRLTPLIAFIPSLSIWPIEFLRWSASVERVNYWIAVWPTLSFIFSYLATSYDAS